MTFGSLFSGIGGFDLGLERAGMKCVWQVEIDDYCNKVLKKHWPEVQRWKDITTFNPAAFVTPDLICGGFPCQDISQVGLGAGIDGEHSGLWSQYFRIVRLVRPRFVVVENVSALLYRGLGRILGDLAGIGYDAEWQSIQASDFARPHRRKRIFIVSYPNKFHESSGLGNGLRNRKEIFEENPSECNAIRVEATTTADRMDHGVSRWLYKRGVGALGNAVVPQIAEWIGRRIIELDTETNI